MISFTFFVFYIIINKVHLSIKGCLLLPIHQPVRSHPSGTHMPVIAVINRKGGSGKSTMATSIAGWCANNGWRVMLGDVDRQQSIKHWLSRRDTEAPEIITWAIDKGKALRAPPGTTHVVLDTPGALYDHHLAKLVVWVDAIVVPIGPSMFDLDASIALLAELQQHPKVRSGRCKVAAVGMRWSDEALAQWRQGASDWAPPLLTVIPDRPQYRQLIESGRCVFDTAAGTPGADAACWEPLTRWLKNVWQQDTTNRAKQPPKTSTSGVPSPALRSKALVPAKPAAAQPEKLQAAGAARSCAASLGNQRSSPAIKTAAPQADSSSNTDRLASLARPQGLGHSRVKPTAQDHADAQHSPVSPVPKRPWVLRFFAKS
jgi:chromosome partitioning protein